MKKLTLINRSIAWFLALLVLSLGQVAYAGPDEKGDEGGDEKEEVGRDLRLAWDKVRALHHFPELLCV